MSILVRFGMIEAFLRYYFADLSQEDRDALARRAVVFLLVATTIAAAALGAAAAPLSQVVLGYRDTTTFLIAVLGLWTFTNLELAYGLLRVDERVKAYAAASLINVAITISASVVLVVGFSGGWAIRSLADSPQGVGVTLLRVAHDAREGLGQAARAAVIGRFGLDQFVDELGRHLGELAGMPRAAEDGS